MLKRFYERNATETKTECAEHVIRHGHPVSPAQIQGYFMRHKTSEAAKVIENIPLIWEYSLTAQPKQEKVVAAA